MVRESPHWRETVATLSLSVSATRKGGGIECEFRAAKEGSGSVDRDAKGLRMKCSNSMWEIFALLNLCR
jgi:hypothetical protein